MDTVVVGIYSFFKEHGPYDFAHIHCPPDCDLKIIQRNFMKS